MTDRQTDRPLDQQKGYTSQTHKTNGRQDTGYTDRQSQKADRQTDRQTVRTSRRVGPTDSQTQVHSQTVQKTRWQTEMGYTQPVQQKGYTDSETDRWADSEVDKQRGWTKRQPDRQTEKTRPWRCTALRSPSLLLPATHDGETCPSAAAGTQSTVLCPI